MTNPIPRITSAVPDTFFKRLVEHTDAGFAEASQITKNHFTGPERINMLAQCRHARCEVGFRRAAQDAGMHVEASLTDPRGGLYSRASIDGVHVLRANIQPHAGPPRRTVFRQQWARCNEGLAPIQRHFFEPDRELPDKALCVMIVTVAHPRADDESIPSFLGVGVPAPDLSDWWPLLSVTELLSRYHDTETSKVALNAKPVTIPDRATPKLKSGSSPTG